MKWITKTIKKNRCDHSIVKYIGKNRKFVKMYECMKCGSVGGQGMAERTQLSKQVIVK